MARITRDFSFALPEGDTTKWVGTDSVQLNEMLGGGLMTGNLIVVQAPSGVGKTTFMMRSFIRTLIAGEKAAYISIGEQDEREILERIACMYNKIDYVSFFKYRSKDDVDKCQKFFDKNFDNMLIHYSDDPFEMHTDLNGNETCEMTAIMHDIVDNDIKFVFIDYLGAAMADRADSQYSYLTKLSGKLKNIATKHNLMIMTAMQTNRPFKTALKDSNFDLTDADESYMADSIGPVRKASVCMTLFEKDGHYRLNVFKNRLNKNLGCITMDMEPLSYKWLEYFGKHGF